MGGKLLGLPHTDGMIRVSRQDVRRVDRSRLSGERVERRGSHVTLFIPSV
jgi:hypothetical protein